MTSTQCESPNEERSDSPMIAPPRHHQHDHHAVYAGGQGSYTANLGGVSLLPRLAELEAPTSQAIAPAIDVFNR